MHVVGFFFPLFSSFSSFSIVGMGRSCNVGMMIGSAGGFFFIRQEHSSGGKFRNSNIAADFHGGACRVWWRCEVEHL
ncbi:hypothetical protein HOY82DRAFT_155288 [Tuber indicum]|nr:hypothetical protein HOY82DRAFT_155288 [Tuber indicum]